MHNDDIRDTLLRHLYLLHKSSRSMNRQQIGIRDLQQVMKFRHGFSQAQVASNLDYLIEQGFVARVLTPRTFHTPSGTTQSSEKITYKIAKAGIDRLEGNSEFRASNAFSNINITTLNSVVAVGNGNTQKLVQRGFEPIIRELDALQRAITDSELPEEGKISAIADVQTIEYQLAKPQVNRSILKEAWTGVEKAVTIGRLPNWLSRWVSSSHHCWPNTVCLTSKHLCVQGGTARVQRTLTKDRGG